MRHRSRKFIPIVVILLVVALFLGYNYTTKKLTLFISKSFEENLGAKLSIKDIKFTLPFCVELKDVKVSDLIKIESVRVYPNPKEFLLRNRVALSMINVINPVVRIKKEEDNEFVLPDILKETKGETSSSFPLESLALSNIRIQNGTFIYEDEEKNILEFVNIKADIKPPAIFFEKDSYFRFHAGGFLKNKDPELLSPLIIKGRVEPDNKIKAKLYASGVKLDTLGDVYDDYLKALVEDGRVDLESEIQISKNNLIAKCAVETDDLALNKDAENSNSPFAASFILLFSFKHKVLKIKDLQSNFLKLISDQP